MKTNRKYKKKERKLVEADRDFHSLSVLTCNHTHAHSLTYTHRFFFFRCWDQRRPISLRLGVRWGSGSKRKIEFVVSFYPCSVALAGWVGKITWASDDVTSGSSILVSQFLSFSSGSLFCLSLKAPYIPHKFQRFSQLSSGYVLWYGEGSETFCRDWNYFCTLSRQMNFCPRRRKRKCVCQVGDLSCEAKNVPRRFAVLFTRPAFLFCHPGLAQAFFARAKCNLTVLPSYFCAWYPHAQQRIFFLQIRRPTRRQAEGGQRARVGARGLQRW